MSRYTDAINIHRIFSNLLKLRLYGKLLLSSVEVPGPLPEKSCLIMSEARNRVHKFFAEYVEIKGYVHHI